MTVETLAIPGVLLLTPRAFHDDRGRFFEFWQEERGVAAGLPARFAQDNVSVSRRGTMRGLHYQHPHGQGKLVGVLAGTVFDVAVDLRAGSPTFGRWVGAELSADNGRQLWIPAGFAHGFMALADDTVFVYKCTERWRPEADRAVRWNDPAIGIAWPALAPVLSPKDADAPLLADVSPAHLPPFIAE